MSKPILFLFTDLETTSLDETKGQIMEASFALCTPDMRMLFEADTIVRCPNVGWLPTSVWEGHLKHGLFSEWIKKTDAPHTDEVDKRVSFALHGKRGGCDLILAGSSVHFDRKWIAAKMPRLEKMLHYRMLDIRSLFLAFQTVGVDINIHEGQTADRHRARADRIWAMNAFKNIQTLISSRSKA